MVAYRPRSLQFWSPLARISFNVSATGDHLPPLATIVATRQGEPDIDPPLRHDLILASHSAGRNARRAAPPPVRGDLAQRHALRERWLCTHPPVALI
jgi:hypothetical protein